MKKILPLQRLALFVILFAQFTVPARAVEVIDSLDVAQVWAGHPVGFCLLTAPPRQYAAYYDADRRMTVASRRLDEREWQYTVLPETIGWDSHNSIVMTLDENGYLHLAGNMHVHPLKYFRTTKPYDAATFERVAAMVGENEERVTYPEFLDGPDGALLFTYRDGRSGSGNQIYNVYDASTQTWRRLLDQPLVDGEGERNAYFDGPFRGPDGWFHLVWVWRDTSACETNHDISYARSRDLVHWESSAGEPFAPPITYATCDVVDPVPVHGGMINGGVRLGFDGEKRPVITYHKFDEKGLTQLYNARLEDGAWKIYQSSDWDYRWDFTGNGSIVFEIQVRPIEVTGAGELVLSWSHTKYGSQRWRVAPGDFAPLEQMPNPETMPAALRKVTSDFPGMGVRTRNDSGTSGDTDTRYVLRWETLGSNRDQAREKPWPEPSQLTLYTLRIADP